jgi:hypothetical protein
MLEELNTWLGHWEPTWLLTVLLAESFIGLFSALVLVKEYFYDMEFNNHMKAARKDRRRKKYEVFTLPETTLTEGESK